MRIVVTGLGLVTPLGCGVTSVWEKLIAGQSGIRRITSFDVSSYPSQIAGQIPEPLEFFEQWVSKKDQRKMGRFILWAIAAAEEALADAGWKPETDHDRERTGVLVGSGIGGLDEISHWSVVLHEKGPSRVGPFFVPSALINLASGHISIRHGLTGPNLSVVTACSTGAHAIGEAAKMIRAGQADIVIAGGGEAAVCPMGVAGFSAMKALSTNFNDHPEKASRPWDKQRDGFVIAEGAGVVVLESLEHAQKRGAKIYAELLGYGMSGDAYHMAAPREDGDGAFRCMKAALKDARLEPYQVQYINAHGTSTPPGDIAELQAIERLFPEKTVVSSTKSSIGHLLGAAGSVEAIFSILTMNTGVVPPTLNLDDPEPTQMDLVAHTARTLNQVDHVLSNSFGFGGTNASLVFGKV
jgi:3-oxoacyl-[acyl-carrier-protein] synthase II